LVLLVAALAVAAGGSLGLLALACLLAVRLPGSHLDPGSTATPGQVIP
jgi:hypothetical protein